MGGSGKLSGSPNLSEAERYSWEERGGVADSFARRGGDTDMRAALPIYGIAQDTKGFYKFRSADIGPALAGRLGEG
jgi:hypothetical protein